MADTAADPTTLLDRFGLSSFRPGQLDVVESLASGEDVMCVMPTGGGKSLCYQLPSLARQGTTIVVSPLIALMKDQVDTLSQLGIDAKLINSSLTPAEQDGVMRQMADGKLDLVYVAPERLRNGRFLEAVRDANVTLLAVDEAHCVSEWGHDFRPDYSRLGQFRERYLDGVQTIALTATATPAVRDDIAELLRLRSPRVFVTGFARKNLRFSVTHAKADRDKEQALVDYLADQPGSGIIYAATRKRCEELAEWLPQRTRRPIGVYHAGLEPGQRQRVQEDFMSGKLDAIVATNAFGMGIDKSDIRYVVHYNMPGSLEAYYQEAGRAGRDGENSDCLLLFSYSDRYIQEFFIESRYPSRDTVRQVYDYLRAREEDPIELTLEQVRAAIGVKDGNEAIGTSETLLAKTGVLKRLDSNSNQAIVRIDTEAATMLDFLPREAKMRRRVMQAIEKVVGKRRREDVYVRPSRLAEIAGIDREQLSRALRELKRLKSFDYVPPFRGRAIHFTDREMPFDQLQIDFDELARRKAAEFEKLEAVIGFARTSDCRQGVILKYFGETDAERCGTCDRCDAAATKKLATGDEVSVNEMKGVDNASLLRGIQVVLSGVTRMHGRFGKNLVAQMLCGSKNKKLQQWKLHQLSTYGLLSGLRQSEVVSVMDGLIEAGLLQQKEVDERRPTIHISDAGRAVMHGHDPLPASVHLPFPLAKRIAAAARSLEGADSRVPTAESGDPSESRSEDEELIEELTGRLKRWRHKTSAAMGIPAYRVLTNATIERIAETVPTDSQQLEAIAGIGPATMEQFGYDIVLLVQGVAEQAAAAEEGESEVVVETDVAADMGACSDRDGGGESNCEASIPPAAPGRLPVADDDRGNVGRSAPEIPESQTPLGDRIPIEDSNSADEPSSSDEQWTWRLFRDGFAAAEVAAIRRCDQDQLVDELIAAVRAGRPVDPGWVRHCDPQGRLRQALESPPTPES